MPARKSAISSYLNAIAGTGAVSEIALYKPFAQYILNDLLGYPDNCLALNERKVSDIPDIKLYSAPRPRQHEGEVWAVAEGKLDDEAVRNPAQREKIWKEQLSRYIRPETYYAILFSPRTMLVCTAGGAPLLEVRLGADAVQSSVRGGSW